MSDNEKPWYRIEMTARWRGESDLECMGTQMVEGAAAPVAAWLRAVADQLDPPRPVARRSDSRELLDSLRRQPGGA